MNPSAASPQLKAFHVLTKPTGPICNLDCKYCFYLEKENLYADTSGWAMREDVLDSYVRQYIESQRAPVISFAWQGGEPMEYDFRTACRRTSEAQASASVIL